MCIRDRRGGALDAVDLDKTQPARTEGLERVGGAQPRDLDAGQRRRCLLYTSDAADERSSVDLGGRRIIKKKNK
mgnify:CR=1 FL=1